MSRPEGDRTYDDASLDATRRATALFLMAQYIVFELDRSPIDAYMSRDSEHSRELLKGVQVVVTFPDVHPQDSPDAPVVYAIPDGEPKPYPVCVSIEVLGPEEVDDGS